MRTLRPEGAPGHRTGVIVQRGENSGDDQLGAARGAYSTHVDRTRLGVRVSGDALRPELRLFGPLLAAVPLASRSGLDAAHV